MTRKINFKHFSHTKLSQIRPPSCRFIKKSVLNGARACCHFSVNCNFEWFRKQAGFDKTGQNVFELYVIILLLIYQLVRAVFEVTNRTISTFLLFARCHLLFFHLIKWDTQIDALKQPGGLFSSDLFQTTCIYKTNKSIYSL